MTLAVTLRQAEPLFSLPVSAPTRRIATETAQAHERIASPGEARLAKSANLTRYTSERRVRSVSDYFTARVAAPALLLEVEALNEG
jgi:hypothetical protein